MGGGSGIGTGIIAVLQAENPWEAAEAWLDPNVKEPAKTWFQGLIDDIGAFFDDPVGWMNEKIWNPVKGWFTDGDG